MVHTNSRIIVTFYVRQDLNEAMKIDWPPCIGYGVQPAENECAMYRVVL